MKEIKINEDNYVLAIDYFNRMLISDRDKETLSNLKIDKDMAFTAVEALEKMLELSKMTRQDVQMFANQAIKNLNKAYAEKLKGQ